MSRKDKPSRNRKRPPTRPSRGQQRSKRGDGGFHHWRIPRASSWVVPTGAMHDVHITDALPFESHRTMLDTVARFHLVTPQMLDDAKGFYRSELDLREFGRFIISTDPKHNETWVFRV